MLQYQACHHCMYTHHRQRPAWIQGQFFFIATCDEPAFDLFLLTTCSTIERCELNATIFWGIFSFSTTSEVSTEWILASWSLSLLSDLLCHCCIPTWSLDTGCNPCAFNIVYPAPGLLLHLSLLTHHHLLHPARFLPPEVPILSIHHYPVPNYLIYSFGRFLAFTTFIAFFITAFCFYNLHWFNCCTIFPFLQAILQPTAYILLTISSIVTIFIHCHRWTICFFIYKHKCPRTCCNIAGI